MSLQEVCVNGTRYRLPPSEGRRLVDWLREDLGLTGTKEACGNGDCGNCNVLLNGRVAPSCCILVHSIADQEVTTIEGLAAHHAEDPLFETFMTCGAFQCGYCTPGMIIAARSFLDDAIKHSNFVTISDVRAAIAGNVCRCTGYVQIVDAILKAAVAQGLSCESMEQYCWIGEEAYGTESNSKQDC